MMLHDERKDLDSERQKKLLRRLVEDLTNSRPDLYYQSTSEIARQIAELIKSGGHLSADDRALLQKLSQRDIAVLLSLN
ncbi:MAG: hypothetical protein AAF346_06050 [Pseudomonadota bacterium]